MGNPNLDSSVPLPLLSLQRIKAIVVFPSADTSTWQSLILFLHSASEDANGPALSIFSAFLTYLVQLLLHYAVDLSLMFLSLDQRRGCIVRCMAQSAANR